MFIKKINRTVLTLWVAAGFLVACQRTSTPVNLSTPRPSSVTQSISPEATGLATLTADFARVTPTSIPTPAKAFVLLVIPPGSDLALVAQVQPALDQLTSQAGMEIKIQPALSEADLTSAAKVVVVIAPDPGTAAFLGKAPDTRFVTIGIAGLAPARNLTRLGADGSSVLPVFLAGYIAAILSPDWRVGILSQPIGAGGQALQDAFINGARYFCGLCRPAFPPFLSYPQSAAITLDKVDWQPAVDLMVKNAVKTVYVDPAVQSQDLLDYLAEAGVNLIGSQTPPDLVLSNWIATIQLDYAGALKNNWTDILAEKQPAQVEVPLVITETGSGLLNSARRRLVDQVLADLEKGLINPASVAGP